jgi:hypothetical protein
MDATLNKTIEEIRKKKPVPTVSEVLEDGRIVEMLHLPYAKQTAFALWQDS